ncbi:uncharacterized protein LOC134783712 isoform X2 [Penaeus indicus]|uniref:uncharacterized protein LOC134783712 isoform X2 n=1 Tax=Penaeus indicus TaxID=29960 RepID=UPI00300C1A35
MGDTRGYGHPPPTQAPVQSAPGGGGYSSYEQNSTYGSGSYGQTPASTAYGSQPNANFSTPPAQGNFGGPPPTQGGYGGGPPSGGSYGGPPSSNGNYGGQGGGYNSGLGMAPPPLSAPPGCGGMYGSPLKQSPAPIPRRDQGRGYYKGNSTIRCLWFFFGFANVDHLLLKDLTEGVKYPPPPPFFSFFLFSFFFPSPKFPKVRALQEGYTHVSFWTLALS